MKTANNTVLITGGGSGIGFETAKSFSQLGNRVILVGRNEPKLKAAAAQLDNAVTIRADVSNKRDLVDLANAIKTDYPETNILINNAGVANTYSINDEQQDVASIASDEMNTNYLAVVRLNELLLPLLKKQEQAAIVNITSIVSLSPALNLPTYSASKAALHSYSQMLRLSLRDTNIKVFDVLPPLVDTELAGPLTGNKIHPSQVARDIVNGIAENEYEIHVGFTAEFYKLFLKSPEDALLKLNGL